MTDLQAPSFTGSNSHHSLSSRVSRQLSARRTARPRTRKEVNQVQKLSQLFASLRREEGQTMAEYGVVLAVITIAVFGALALLSGNIVSAVTRVAGYIT